MRGLQAGTGGSVQALDVERRQNQLGFDVFQVNVVLKVVAKDLAAYSRIPVGTISSSPFTYARGTGGVRLMRNIPAGRHFRAACECGAGIREAVGDDAAASE